MIIAELREYRAQLPSRASPNMNVAFEFVAKKYPKPGRDRVRTLYREVFGTRARGRPNKIAEK
jgi:hypothetical protein